MLFPSGTAIEPPAASQGRLRAVVHYAEIGLKGKNRPWFEARLADNLRRALKGIPGAKVRREFGRLIAEAGEEASWEEVSRRLRRVFGVAHFARALECPADLSLIEETLRGMAEGKDIGSFAVRAKRADKTFPLTSPEINARLGKFLQDLTGAPVDLDRPKTTFHVEILSRRALAWFEREPGPGGLPVGVSGRALTLLSGGIDSPVASWLMMKRGCRIQAVHFHSAPYTDSASREKVREIAGILASFQNGLRLRLVPFAPVQQRIVSDAPEPLRVILYRRFMARIAEALAREDKALALVTGDSLGQVASQTLPNLCVIEAAATIPILRPLVGLDKQEIVALAERIGTYRISIEPHQDCCSYLMPKRPATKARLFDVEKAESGLPVREMVEGALKETEKLDVAPGDAEGK